MASRNTEDLTVDDIKEIREVLIFYAELLEKSEALMIEKGKLLRTDGRTQLRKGLFSLRKMLLKHHGEAILDRFPQVEDWSQHSQKKAPVNALIAKKANDKARRKKT